MLVNDVILESYYDFVKDDNVEDIIDHAKSDRRGPSNPIYVEYVVKDNSKYDGIKLIIMAYKPKNPNELEAKQIDQEGWLIELRAMFHKGSNTHHEKYNVNQFQKLMDKLNDAGNVERIEEDLRAWFGKGKKGGAGGGGWDRYNTKGERIGKCGDSKKGEGKPKCLSKSRAASLRAKGGKKAIAAAVRKKRKNDPNKNRRGKAKNVSNTTRKS
jgi:hypothetical protein